MPVDGTAAATWRSFVVGAGERAGKLREGRAGAGRGVGPGAVKALPKSWRGVQLGGVRAGVGALHTGAGWKAERAAGRSDGKKASRGRRRRRCSVKGTEGNGGGDGRRQRRVGGAASLADSRARSWQRRPLHRRCACEGGEGAWLEAGRQLGLLPTWA